MKPRILIFGGTAEARQLAGRLLAEGFDPVTSLAGVTQQPMQPEGRMVSGGMGGMDGIASFVQRENIALIVDATHPFATTISANAAAAAQLSGIPVLRLERAPWQPQPGDRWLEVADAASALSALPPRARVMLAVGRKACRPFLARPGLSGIIRMIEAPEFVIPPQWTVVTARPPFSLEGEIALLTEQRIEMIVSKNAGGSQTAAKLAAARNLGLPVVMINRPAKVVVPAFAVEEKLVAAIRRALQA